MDDFENLRDSAMTDEDSDATFLSNGLSLFSEATECPAVGLENRWLRWLASTALLETNFYSMLLKSPKIIVEIQVFP